MSEISQILDGMAGLRIPGGCDRCDAYQTVTQQHGMHVINVHHDDTCPTWRAMQARREAEP